MEKVVIGTLLAFAGVAGEILTKGYMYYRHFSGLFMSHDLVFGVLTLDTLMFSMILLGIFLIWTDMKPVLKDAF